MQQGNISLTLLILIAVLSMHAILAAQTNVIHASSQALALFDSAKNSNLYCRTSLEQVIVQGPMQLAFTPGSDNERVIPCLPGRWDHAAPGQPRTSSSPIVCAIIHKLNIPTAKLRGIKCD